MATIELISYGIKQYLPQRNLLLFRETEDIFLKITRSTLNRTWVMCQIEWQQINDMGYLEMKKYMQWQTYLEGGGKIYIGAQCFLTCRCLQCETAEHFQRSNVNFYILSIPVTMALYTYLVI